MHSGHRERMRQRIENNGINSLQSHEILEYLLYPFVPRKDTNPLAHNLIEHFNSLSGVFDASVEDLENVVGISHITAVFLNSFKGVMTCYQKDKLKNKIKLDTLKKASDYAHTFMSYENKEHAYVFLLNNQSELIKSQLLSVGTVDKVGVYIREITELAIKYNATNIIICHNHPSGNPYPSLDDVFLTQGIYTALRMLNIRLLDHIIIAGNKDFSMRANGDMEDIKNNWEEKLGDSFFENTINYKWSEK